MNGDEIAAVLRVIADNDNGRAGVTLYKIARYNSRGMGRQKCFKVLEALIGHGFVEVWDDIDKRGRTIVWHSLSVKMVELIMSGSLRDLGVTIALLRQVEARIEDFYIAVKRAQDAVPEDEWKENGEIIGLMLMYPKFRRLAQKFNEREPKLQLFYWTDAQLKHLEQLYELVIGER